MAPWRLLTLGTAGNEAVASLAVGFTAQNTRTAWNGTERNDTKRNETKRLWRLLTLGTVAVPFVFDFSKTERYCIERYWERFFDAYCMYVYHWSEW